MALPRRLLLNDLPCRGFLDPGPVLTRTGPLFFLKGPRNTPFFRSLSYTLGNLGFRFIVIPMIHPKPST